MASLDLHSWSLDLQRTEVNMEVIEGWRVVKVLPVGRLLSKLFLEYFPHPHLHVFEHVDMGRVQISYTVESSVVHNTQVMHLVLFFIKIFWVWNKDEALLPLLPVSYSLSLCQAIEDIVDPLVMHYFLWEILQEVLLRGLFSQLFGLLFVFFVLFLGRRAHELEFPLGGDNNRVVVVDVIGKCQGLRLYGLEC